VVQNIINNIKMNNDVDKLIEYFSKFPGIGARQAKRFAYFLLMRDEDFIKELSFLISNVKKNTAQCASCFRFYSFINS